MNIPAIVVDDPWLTPYIPEIQRRIDSFDQKLSSINERFGSLDSFASAYKYLGFNYDTEKKGWWYREWAPAAYSLSLIGDFNNWNRDTHPLNKLENGVWEIFVADGEDGLLHAQKVKVHIHGETGHMDRIPAYITRTIQDINTYDFAGQLWKPAKEFKWTDKKFKPTTKAPIIYECHIGMAQEREGVGSYAEFTALTLPRIAALGYNTIQIMAIMEHPYYGSFGYHVSNFFAASSRFGTPEELKTLIDTAHKLGITVLLDIVHSHAVKNVAEGLAQFDGSDGQYFHDGPRGFHTQWDSYLFNYGKEEVLQFLLSNLKFWIEEYHFDGFRFDGITSMLYFHHGITDFDHYDKYFVSMVDWDVLTYLQLANTLIHEIKPNALSIAEDMSGMPGMCRLPAEGGLGFDYRLGMGIPDYWIKIIKEKADEDWDIHEMWGMLGNRRWKEKTIAYAESHDQALVGDKTLAFWLMDKEMYFSMSVHQHNHIIDRGMAMHKMLRLITFAIGGEGYLNFIGNEFGHPEWVDFPRIGNDWSYKYARRQWSLADNPDLKYKFLLNFDKAMLALEQEKNILNASPAVQLHMDTTNKVIVAERNNLIFVYSFNPHLSIQDYQFYVPQNGTYRIILNTDRPEFGGFNRIDDNLDYHAIDNKLSIYLTNRTALVLERVK